MRFYKHADDELRTVEFPLGEIKEAADDLVNVCQFCGEIPEDCTCDRGESINRGIKEIRGLAIGIINTADDQLIGPRDRLDVGCVIADCAGLAETIKDKADKLMAQYEEGRGP